MPEILQTFRKICGFSGGANIKDSEAFPLMALYYFDTSIWLDLFENRDEPNLPKGRWANELVAKIISEGGRIVYSNLTIKELRFNGYNEYDLYGRFQEIRYLLIYVRVSTEQHGRAKDLSKKRELPIGDAIHALVARGAGAVLVALDHDFKKLLDIIEYKKPQDLL